mgnify:CR=1 FL=1|tara:strand:+ start:592 stop:846 length:255 start_codon:yes stop_codon:yes gene_type:complete
MAAVALGLANNITNNDDFNAGKNECLVLCVIFFVVFGIVTLIYLWFCSKACCNRPVYKNNTELVEDLLKSDYYEIDDDGDVSEV